MRILMFVTVAALAVTSCAPSPLYLGRKRVGTPGEVPRDERGEPLWALIPPPPPPSPAPPAAVTAPAPLANAVYRPQRVRSGDVGRRPGAEVPRDAAGEPLWALIPNQPAFSAPRPFPVEPIAVAATPDTAATGRGGQ